MQSFYTHCVQSFHANPAFDSSAPDSSLNSQRSWFARFRVCCSLGRPGKLPPVISELGVYRPGYLPQEGHRLTQFPDPGHTRSRVSSPTSLCPFTLRFRCTLRVGF